MKALLVFDSAKGKEALLENTMTALENSSLYGFLTQGSQMEEEKQVCERLPYLEKSHGLS